MKKSAKALVTLLFCLSILAATFVPSFAASVAQVKSVTATNVTHNSATITWAKVSKASGYQVQQYNESKKAWTQVGKDLKSSVTSLKVSKLTTGTTYKYRVRAYSKSIVGKVTYGSYSATLSIKPMPAKVTGLKATATTVSVKLTWTKVAGITGYYVQQYDTANKKWKTVSTIKSNTASAEIKKLTINTTYKFRVAAYYTANKKTSTGSYSDTVSVKTALAQVTSFKASAVTPTNATLSWKTVSEATGYIIEKQGTNSKWSTLATVKGAKTVSYALKATPNTTYKLRITAYKTVSKKDYKSASSETITFKTTVASATNLKTASTLPTSVKLTWTKAANATGYLVQKLNTSTKEWETISKATGASSTVKNLLPGTKYSFRVVSYVTGNDNKDYSGSPTATVTYKPSVPGATNLTTSSITSTSVKLSWTKAANVTGYKVQSYANNQWNDVKKVTSTSYTVSSLSPLTSYKYRVVSYVTASNKKDYTGTPSNEASVQTVCSAPENFEIFELTNTTATFTWSPVSGASGYKVYKLNTSTNAYESIASTTETTCTVSNLSTLTSYTFVVAAYSTSGSAEITGDYSSALSGKTSEYAVKNLRSTYTGTVSDDGSSRYQVQWTIPSKTTTVDSTTTTEYYRNMLVETYNYNHTADASGNVPEWLPYRTTDDGKNYIRSKYMYYYTTPDAFEMNAVYDGSFYTTVTWSSVEGATSYDVQYATIDVEDNTQWWVTAATVTDSNSATIVLPADVTATVRVVANNAKIRVCAYDDNDVLKANYSVIRTAGSTSNTVTIKTNPTGELNTSSNQSKTLYALMVAQAINQTKCERDTVNVSINSTTSSSVDYISLKGKIGILPINSTFHKIEELVDFLNGISKTLGGKTIIDMNELTGDLDENVSISGEANNGTLQYKNSDGVVKSDELIDMISPYGELANLYQAENVNDFSKKITSISSQNNSDGGKTITLTLAKESVNNENETMNVHNGFCEGMSGISMEDGSTTISMGATKIVAKINANGTLDSYTVSSPMSIVSTMDMSDGSNKLDISIALNGTTNSSFTFTR